LQDPPKFTQIGIFGLNLATLPTTIKKVPRKWFPKDATERTDQVFGESTSKNVSCIRPLNQLLTNLLKLVKVKKKCKTKKVTNYI
jgi:hypothetical protein